MSVDSQIGKRPVSVVLLRERFPCGLEVIEILFRPPIRKPSLSIKLTALIIEAVTDFMPDDRAHRSIVICSVRSRIEIWRLKNGSGEVQRILQRQIDGIDGLRRHPPFILINRLIELR